MKSFKWLFWIVHGDVCSTLTIMESFKEKDWSYLRGPWGSKIVSSNIICMWPPIELIELDVLQFKNAFAFYSALILTSAYSLIFPYYIQNFGINCVSKINLRKWLQRIKNMINFHWYHKKIKTKIKLKILTLPAHISSTVPFHNEAFAYFCYINIFGYGF